MNKSKNFSGQPIIKQVLKFLDHNDVYRTAKKHNSDKYTKKFTTYEHLVTMIFSVISGSSSLREVSSIMLACEGNINHLGLKDFPKRSTLSDANKRRSAEVFADIYGLLYKRYRHFLSDSRTREPAVKDLKIVDSSTITLFSDILKGVGRNPMGGKKKGGIKMHTMINAMEDVPCLIKFSNAATHDHVFLKELDLKKGSFVVFDKGYVDYKQYQQWTLDDIYFVTRQKDNARYTSLEEFDIPDKMDDAVLKDEKIILIDKKNGEFQLRRIAFWHEEKRKVYEFITNNYELEADKIADIYKNRWQIETMFKRLKQNFPLKYFLGDNQNAIEIQIWVSLIIQLIMLVIQRKAERNWAYSNMMSVIRYHLMTYIDLFKFLKNPDSKYEEITTKNIGQLSIFDP
ncbi:IS4 family transposase [Salegentibacter maritimus]|uniref:IS4 family transposase n=1 Tax=Salegentibacter maritimus TaxID=2794347 RepID=UPI0018E4A325|nr:IS4 family transposase [Salegentibacter maritimus]MBI6117607.1 IS4 family transposase [Salegentibacter maritimus]